MKTTALALIVFLTALTSFAVRNPQIRACNSVGGQFFVVNSEFDQLGLCRIDLSVIGAIDILNRDAAIEVPLSLNNYKNGIKACATQNLTTLTTFEGESIYVCQYADGSIIDIETLSSGKDSNRNLELNKVLNITR